MRFAGKTPRKSFDLSLARAAQVSTTGLFILAIVYTLTYASAVLLPVLIAALISMVLETPVRALVKLRVPESFAAVLVILALLVGLSFGLNRLLGPANEWITRAPDALEDVRHKFVDVTEKIRFAREASEKIENIAVEEGVAEDESVLVRGPTLLEQSVSYTWTTFTQAVLTIVLLFFFLAHGPRTLEGTLRLLPTERYRQYSRNLFAAVQGQLGSYLRTLAMIYLALGALTALAMWWLKMPNPLLWGAMAFILGFIPYIGPVVTTTIIALVAVISYEQPIDMALPVIAYVFLTVVEGFFVTPNLIGRTMTLNPLAVLLSIVFWGWLWGFPGAFLGVPILALIKLIVDHAAGVRSIEDVADDFLPEDSPASEQFSTEVEKVSPPGG